MTTPELHDQLRATQEAFDSVAADYDGPRGNNDAIQDMRSEMWRWLDATFTPGSRLIDLGCGTGLDAVRMRASAIGSRRRTGRRRWSSARAIAPNAPAWPNACRPCPWARTNCSTSTARTPSTASIPTRPVELRARPRRRLARMRRLLQPGGALVFTVIGRLCPWEIAHYAKRRRWDRVALRFARHVVPVGMNKRTIWTRYFTPNEFYKDFEAEFTLEHVRGLCVFVPPPYLTWIRDRHPAWHERLWRWDRRMASWAVGASDGRSFPDRDAQAQHLMHLGREFVAGHLQRRDPGHETADD